MRVVSAESVKTSAAGAENTKIRGCAYNSSGIFFSKNRVSGPALIKDLPEKITLESGQTANLNFA